MNLYQSRSEKRKKKNVTSLQTIIPGVDERMVKEKRGTEILQPEENKDLEK